MRRALVLPLIVVPLVACSGGSGSGPSLQDQRAAYLRSTEAVCKDANGSAAKLTPPTTIAGVPQFADAGLQIVRTTVDRIAAVPPPPADRAQIEAKVSGPIRTDLGTVTTYVDQVKQAAAANDSPALLRLLQDRPRTTADVAFMRQYGFVECVKAVQQAGG